MVIDLGTPVRVAMDEANTKGCRKDAVLEGVIAGVCERLAREMK